MAGLLFLTATAGFIGASTLIADVLARPDCRTGASTQSPALTTGALLLAGQFGIAGIAVLLCPALKPWGESLTQAHVGLRVAQLAASRFYLAVLLMVIELGTGPGEGTVDAAARAVMRPEKITSSRRAAFTGSITAAGSGSGPPPPGLLARWAPRAR